MSLLLCYDGSPSAKHAITVAHATLGHKPLTLLHVFNPPEEVLADAFGFVVEPRVERSQTAVWQTILDVAAQTDAELIVIGTHGATAVQSALLGSISNAVVHHSERPVLVVPTPAKGARNQRP
jgi:hypothetical protein